MLGLTDGVVDKNGVADKDLTSNVFEDELVGWIAAVEGLADL